MPNLQARRLLWLRVAVTASHHPRLHRTHTPCPDPSASKTAFGVLRNDWDIGPPQEEFSKHVLYDTTPVRVVHLFLQLKRRQLTSPPTSPKKKKGTSESPTIAFP